MSKPVVGLPDTPKCPGCGLRHEQQISHYLGMEVISCPNCPPDHLYFLNTRDSSPDTPNLGAADS